MYIIKTITYTLLFLSCFASCKTKQEELPLVIPEPGTLEKIEQRGVLNVCSYYNTTDYYVYKGIPKGFHYELVKDFADYLGVKLNIEINTNIDESIQKLNEGQYDLIAMSLSVTDSRKEDVQFSLPLFTTSQVLVQHTSDTLLQSVDDLKGKEIFLQEGTSFTRFLQHLNDSLQLNLKITELEDVTFEDILLKIENGEIPYELAYCEGELLEQYLHDMQIMQEFADWNRRAITDTILKGCKLKEQGRFTTIHNYIDIENRILRKGAVSAQAEELLLIPINMRDGSLICRGKGNAEWNCSAPHGAGRLMSRSDAKNSFTVHAYRKEMEGIYSSTVSAETLDECPMAYKSKEAILEQITPTAEVVREIQPVYNFKAE